MDWIKYMKKYKFILITLVAYLLFVSNFVHASVLNINVDKNEIQKGGLNTVHINLDTEQNLINAIEGDLVYSNKDLIIEKVNIGSSFVSFWVEQPKINVDGRIHFSGIVPGGIAVSKGEVFSVTVRGVIDGQTNIKLENVNLLLNDGQGSKDEAKTKDINFTITENLNGEEEKIGSNDTTKPEKFTVERTKSPYIYDNQWFVVFSTQDKGVGIDYYEVCEFVKSNCVKADSPYLLQHQTPFFRVIVRAYDTDSNMRSVVLISRWLVFVVFVFFVLIGSIFLYLRHRYLRTNKV